MPVRPAGGAESASGTSSRPTARAERSSSQRHAARRTHSGGSTPAASGGTVGPPSALTPQYSKHHSRTSMPAISTRLARIAAVAFAFSGASGHENATRVSPAHPAWYVRSALYVSVAGFPRTPETWTRSSPRSVNVALVKSATTSGEKYDAGSCTSYRSWWRTVSTFTRPPDVAGFEITAVPSAVTSAIGYGSFHGSGIVHHSPEKLPPAT